MQQNVPDRGFEFSLQGVAGSDIVDWHIDGVDVVRQTGARYVWPLARGEHSVSAVVWRNGQRVARIDETEFVVK